MLSIFRTSMMAPLLLSALMHASHAAAQDPAPAASSEYDPATADAEMMPIKGVLLGLFTDITAYSKGAIAVGERGHIVYSANLKDWTQAPTPTRSLLTNVFARGDLVWAVGHEQVILHSKDAGASWTRQFINKDAFGPFLDVIFFDDQRGLVIGVEGTLFETTDGGANWQEAMITDRLSETPSQEAAVSEGDESDSQLASDDMGVDETPPHLNAITRNSQGLLIVGENGAIYSSTDDAKSFKKRELPYNGSMFGAVTLDNDAIVAYGLNGRLFMTQDLGASWTQLESNSDASVMGAAAVSGGRAVFVGSRGSVFTKGAESNQLAAFTFQDGGALAGVVVADDGSFVVAGENGILTFRPERK
jgi:photosystem II stability/assembly factor-like uncharacterized protein